MLIDSETDLLFLSETLKARKTFFDRLVHLLIEENINYNLLPLTNDIWAVDYMPVQIDQNKFVQFRYEPDYLQNAEFISTQTDAKLTCNSLGITAIDSDLKVDGGNIIKGKDWIILTDKIFKENRNLNENTIIGELENLFQARAIIIPQDPDDFTGHADGMVRYYDYETVLVNDYRANNRPAFQAKLRKSLKDQGLKMIALPYNPYYNKDADSADGLYINYLQMKDFILLPIFSLMTDEEALRQFEQLFPLHTIKIIDCREISCDGGVLNCITWNIKS